MRARESSSQARTATASRRVASAVAAASKDAESGSVSCPP
jgi:hypothetical protein